MMTAHEIDSFVTEPDNHDFADFILGFCMGIEVDSTGEILSSLQRRFGVVVQGVCMLLLT